MWTSAGFDIKVEQTTADTNIDLHHKVTKTFIGLDPSFTGTGIAFIHQDSNIVEFNELSSDMDKHSTISKLEAIKRLSKNIAVLIKNATLEAAYIGQEVSTAYTGWFVAELYGLAFGIYQQLTELDKLVVDHCLYSQEYIKFIHGHKRTKEDTIFMIEKEILPIFIKYGYTIYKHKTAMTSTGVKQGNRYIKEETITNNEADAFIYSLREFIKFNKDLPLSKEILDLYPRFSIDNKELK